VRDASTREQTPWLSYPLAAAVQASVRETPAAAEARTAIPSLPSTLVPLDEKTHYLPIFWMKLVDRIANLVEVVVSSNRTRCHATYDL
jgi:hypothetical protein